MICFWDFIVIVKLIMSGRDFGVKEFELCFVELGTLMRGLIVEFLG